MKPRTAAVSAVILLALLSVVVFAGTGIPGGGGTLSETWVSDTARDYQSNHHPVAAAEIGGETAVVAPINELSTVPDLTDESCALVRLDPATGGDEWRAGLPKEHCTTHALTGPTIADLDGDGSAEVLVASGDHALVARDVDTGAVEWRHPITGLGYSEPAVGDVLPADGSEVVVADIRGAVFLVRADGTTAWRREHSSSTWANPQVASFDGDDGAEIAVATGDAVFLYEADGDLAWRANVSGQWAAVGQADDDPAAELFVAENRRVTALDGDDGSVIWARTTESIAAIHAVGDGNGDGDDEVYAAVSGGRLHALGARDGSIEWTTRFSGENRIAPPPSMGDLDGDGTPELVAVTMDGLVAVLDPETGDRLATYEREVPIWTYPTLADADGDGDDDVFVTYGDGRIVMLSFESA